MALASTRPIIDLAESALRRLATLGGGTPAAWWITILIVGPLLGSLDHGAGRDDDFARSCSTASSTTSSRGIR